MKGKNHIEPAGSMNSKEQVVSLKPKIFKVACEEAMRAYDVNVDELFSEAQLENFHRRVMKAVSEQDGKQTMRPMRTGVPPWRGLPLRVIRSFPVLPVVSFMLLNLPYTVKAHWQKISETSSITGWWS